MEHGQQQEWYIYDASGNRVLKRSISGSTTSLTAYAFGLQELSYNGSGVATGQIDYYSIAGRLIGSTDGTNTTYDLTDAQGSVLMTLNSTAVVGEQAYGPYGNQRYTQGTIGTDKGYTGQFHDSVTGLDYYNARYYDPVVGRFLSPDDVQGNAQAMDPYAYVSGNPETLTDPTGKKVACGPDGCGNGGNDGGGDNGGDGGSPPPPPPHAPGHGPTNGGGNSGGDPNSGQCGGCKNVTTTPGHRSTPPGTCQDNDINCHGQKSQRALDSYYQGQIKTLSMVLDGISVLADIALIFSLKTLLQGGGAIAAFIQGLAAFGHALHFVANLIISTNNNVISQFAEALLGFGDAMGVLASAINSVWLGLFWLGFLTGTFSDAALAPEIAAVAVGATATVEILDLLMGITQSGIDIFRVDQSQVDNDMTPKQKYDKCLAILGAPNC